jgi:AraC-like DNA-binding protein
VGSHLAEKISIEQMSGLTGYSETHFIRFFQKTTGLRFTDWLNRYRLSMATRLLTLSDDPITDVAAQTGFNNLSYFNRSFKQKYGMTPHEYRKQNR